MSNGRAKIAPGEATINLGGVPEPAAEQLCAMRSEPFVYHARGGKLNKVAAEKIKLPHDPRGHLQKLAIASAPDGTVYVNQGSIMCKSADGGRTWDAWPSQLKASANDSFCILKNGTFIAPRNADYDNEPLRIVAWASDDEGRTARIVGQVPEPAVNQLGFEQAIKGRYPNPMAQMSDDTLVIAVESRIHHFGTSPTYVFRSGDGGRTWDGNTRLDRGPGFLGCFCFETMIAPMASGKLLAVSRYHGPVVPTWPAYPQDEHLWYKSMFLSDSHDGGVTWQNLRPLTNIFGQCHGYAVGLDDGSVAVTHDHRQPPGTSAGKALISRDEGQTWQDEVYYLYYGQTNTGYSQSVALDDGLILTVCVASDETEVPQPPGQPDSYTGHSDYWAIRWKLVD